MNFFRQVMVALVLSLVGGALAAVGASLKLVIGLASMTYAFDLLWQSSQPVGRVVVAAALIAATAMGFFWLDTWTFVLTQLFVVWLARCLYLHSRPLTCLADLGLIGGAYAAAVWVSKTGSVFLTLWSFFLVQALFVWLPGGQTNDAVDTTMRSRKPRERLMWRCRAC